MRSGEKSHANFLQVSWMAHCRTLWVQAGSPYGTECQYPSSNLGIPDIEGAQFVSEVSPQAFVSAAPDLVVVAHSEDRAAAIRAVRDVRALCTQVPILFLAGESCETLVIDAFHAGVTRYLRHPWTPAQCSDVVRELSANAEVPHLLQEQQSTLNGNCPFVGNSLAMCELRKYIRRIAPTDTNVLITGETGTGKELIAQLIHENSERRYRPFVCLNSAAIPDSLIESELFGYERGAFTGAHAPYDGKLAAAHRGTAFLDEIGDISASAQAKILRAIENKRIYRLGSSQGQNLDIRVLAATNRDLELAAQQGGFRSDLYFRLNVLKIEIPPLRERVEDVPPLVDYYIRQFNAKFRRNIVGLRPGSMDLLAHYQWPGNVRELKNFMEAVFVNLPLGMEGVVDLPVEVFRQFAKSAPFKSTERTRLLRVLSASKWNKTEAAKALHCSRMTLYRKMNRYNVSSSLHDLPHP
jgi:DNA-binding NtrC family response regulator